MVRLKRRIEMRRMSICLTWFPIKGLGKPKLYHDSGVFYKNVGKLGRGILRGITLEIFSFRNILNNLEKQ